MTEPELDAVVVGGGAAGLTAAAALAAAGRAVRLLEATPRVGGAVWTERIRDHRVERGPNTLRVGPRAAAVLRRLGLDALLLEAQPASRLRFLLRQGRLVPVPLGPAALLGTPLLSARGKLRLLVEPFVRRGDPAGESVAEFVTRRLGPEATDALVGPFLTGVYAGDEARLGAEAVFPSLVEAERSHGSIVRGLAARALVRRGPRGLRGTWSARAGLGELTGRLARDLAGQISLETRAAAIARDPAGFRVACQDGGTELRTRSVVVATPAREAADLVRGLDAEAARALAAISYAPVASVSLSLDPAEVRSRIEGFGFLVPRGEGRELLGCLFLSQLFPDRAPPGRELLTALLGGTRSPAALELSDEELFRVCVAELDRVLGLRAAPRCLAVTRWREAVPQPDRQHPRRVAEVRRRLAAHPGLELAGAHLDGVALGDAMASGGAAAERLLRPC